MSNLLSQASLVMIPSGYKEDVVYSQIPTSGAGDLSFTRASNGTRINSAGLVEVVAWNLLTYSEEFDNAGWNKDLGATVTANTTTAPNGTTTADTLTIANGQYLYQYVTLNAGQSYTISVYVRVASGTKQFKFNTYGSGNDFTSSTYTATTEWQRFEYTFTTVGSGSTGIYPVLVDGLPSATFFIWGAQLNIGSTAKPYFPTTDRLNVPRLTYQNGGGGCPSLLLEKQSTNLNIYSEDYTNATWDKLDIVTTNYSNVVISPDGTQNASKLIPNTTSSSYHGLQLSSGRPSLTGGVVYTYSLFAKAQGYTKIRLQNFSQAVRAQFDLSNGTLINQSGTTTTFIDSMGNGWYRIGFTYTQSSTQSSYWNILVVSTDDNSSTAPVAFSGNGTDAIAIYGAQLEASTYATSYIPTTSASATRVADECSKTGITSLIGQTEGVLFVDFVFTAFDGSAKWIAFLGGGANYIGLYANSNTYIIGEVSNTTSQFSGAYSFSVGQRYKIAIAYKANDFAYYVNGSQITTSSSGTVPTTSDFTFLYSTTNDRIGGKVYNQMALFKTRLTNAELASLTTI